MKIKVVKEIEHCAECPFLIDGNGKESDFCGHKSSHMRGYAILQSESNVGFPKKCPLLKGKYLREYNKQIVLKSKLKKIPWSLTFGDEDDKMIINKVMKTIINKQNKRQNNGRKKYK